MFGWEWLMVEFCCLSVLFGVVLLVVFDMFVLLVECVRELVCCVLLLWILELEVVVCVVRFGGSFIGFVGDLIFGLINFVVVGDVWSGGGFFIEEGVEVFVVGVVVFGVIVFLVWDIFFLGVCLGVVKFG